MIANAQNVPFDIDILASCLPQIFWMFKQANMMSGISDQNVFTLQLGEFICLVCQMGMQLYALAAILHCVHCAGSCFGTTSGVTSHQQRRL